MTRPVPSTINLTFGRRARVEAPEEHFRSEDGGKLQPDALHVEQHCRWHCDLLRGKQLSLGLHRLDLLEQQSADRVHGEPAPSVLRQQATIAGLERIQPRPAGRGAAVRSQISPVRTAALNAIDVPDPLGDQDLALAAEAAAVLFLGVGALTIAHTRGSPRLYASSARTSASPSILSVFARRRRRDVAIEAGSTTWLSIPSFCSTRSIQNPSRPAS